MDFGKFEERAEILFLLEAGHTWFNPLIVTEFSLPGPFIRELGL